ncbi:MAG TPA: YetF domain-containing protein [Rhodopila sp.]|nr:YetF domain-containing protein [Rhodopila sp.]
MSDWVYHNLLRINWQRSFNPDVPLLDIVMRGTIIYLVLFTLLRVTRRQSGQIGISDVLLVVLIAGAVQNAMAGDYHSITEGLGLVLTIFFWSWFLDWLAVHVPVLRPLLTASPRVVVRNGRIDHRAHRQELMTKDDLLSQLRLHGIQNVEDVRHARIEADGQVSVERIQPEA